MFFFNAIKLYCLYYFVIYSTIHCIISEATALKHTDCLSSPMLVAVVVLIWSLSAVFQGKTGDDPSQSGMKTAKNVKVNLIGRRNFWFQKIDLQNVFMLFLDTKMSKVLTFKKLITKKKFFMFFLRAKQTMCSDPQHKILSSLVL